MIEKRQCRKWAMLSMNKAVVFQIDIANAGLGHTVRHTRYNQIANCLSHRNQTNVDLQSS
jgi:hypothetical protein